MAMSFDVTLPRSAKPVFPARCPCGGGPVGSKGVRLSFVGYASSPSLVDVALDISNAGGNTINYAVVPASDGCAQQLKRYHFWIKIAKYVTWAPAFLVALALGLPGYASIAVLLGALVLPVFWEILNPPPVGATPKPKVIVWEFAKRDYAEEFARLNDTVIDGEAKPAVPIAAIEETPEVKPQRLID